MSLKIHSKSPALNAWATIFQMTGFFLELFKTYKID